MASIYITLPPIKLQPLSSQPTIYNTNHQISTIKLKFRTKIQFNYTPNTSQNFRFRVCCSSENSDDKEVKNEVQKEQEQDIIVESRNPVGRLRETINSVTPLLFMMKKKIGADYAIGLCVVVAVLVISVRAYLTNRSASNHHGSVADLVKRGQLRSDRRGISRPLKYDDPFDNPLVKVSKNKSTVEMCGKVYRLAPVTLTEAEQSSHQKRRSRAYQWKRPTLFLKEGDSIPPDVDPDTIRWIPANHPFATTVNDLDEDVAQSNVYQKNGVPFRIKAEHEALQRKLEALQSEQKLNKMVIEPGNARDYERPFKSTLHENAEQRSPGKQGDTSKSPKLDNGTISSESKNSFDELQKP